MKYAHHWAPLPDNVPACRSKGARGVLVTTEKSAVTCRRCRHSLGLPNPPLVYEPKDHSTMTDLELANHRVRVLVDNARVTEAEVVRICAERDERALSQIRDGIRLFLSEYGESEDLERLADAFDAFEASRKSNEEYGEYLAKEAARDKT